MSRRVGQRFSGESHSESLSPLRLRPTRKSKIENSRRVSEQKGAVLLRYRAPGIELVLERVMSKAFVFWRRFREGRDYIALPRLYTLRETDLSLRGK